MRRQARHTPQGRRAPGELESEILAALWAADGALTAAQVQHAMGLELAYNTVQTILTRLHDKGLVRRSTAGRAHAYVPTRRAEELLAEQMRTLLRRGPDRTMVLQRFVSTLNSDEESALRQLLGL